MNVCCFIKVHLTIGKQKSILSHHAKFIPIRVIKRFFFSQRTVGNLVTHHEPKCTGAGKRGTVGGVSPIIKQHIAVLIEDYRGWWLCRLSVQTTSNTNAAEMQSCSLLLYFLVSQVKLVKCKLHNSVRYMHMWMLPVKQRIKSSCHYADSVINGGRVPCALLSS